MTSIESAMAPAMSRRCEG